MITRRDAEKLNDAPIGGRNRYAIFLPAPFTFWTLMVIDWNRLNRLCSGAVTLSAAEEKVKRSLMLNEARLSPKKRRKIERRRQIDMQIEFCSYL